MMSSFGIGFALTEYWWVDLIVLLVIAFIWAGKHFQIQWLGDVALVCFSCIAIAGIFMGVRSALMIAGAASSLICWELNRQVPMLHNKNNSLATLSFENCRFKILCLSVGTGLLIAEISLLLNFKLSFGVMFLIVAVILYSLFKFIQLLKNSSD
ncbi:MAG: hypothetical protein ABFD58_09035 [Anaerolineaceae bacterium]